MYFLENRRVQTPPQISCVWASGNLTRKTAKLHGPKIGTESKDLICDNVERNNEVLRRDGLGADVCSTHGLTDLQTVREHGSKVPYRVRGLAGAKTHGFGRWTTAMQQLVRRDLTPEDIIPVSAETCGFQALAVDGRNQMAIRDMGKHHASGRTVAGQTFASDIDYLHASAKMFQPAR